MFCHVGTYYNLLFLYAYGDRVPTTNSGMLEIGSLDFNMTAASPKIVEYEFVCGEFVHKRAQKTVDISICVRNGGTQKKFCSDTRV